MKIPIRAISCAVAAFITASTTHAQTSYSNAVLSLHPVAYWPLNETAQPPAETSAIATNYGTLSSAADGTFSHVNGMVYGYPGALASDTNTADGFRNNGGDDTLYVSALPSPDISAAPSFTVEAWLLNHIPNATTQCALSDVNANSPRSGWLLYVDIDNPGQYAFRTYNQNGTSFSLDFQMGAANSIVADQWYHVVVVVSNGVTATNVYGYINGALVAGPTPLPSYVPNDDQANGLTIGARSDVSFGFDGAIDEVAFYTNALDAATVLAHYQAGTNPAPATPYKTLVLQQNPTVYYRLDESAVAPFLVPLPVATNYGSYGASADGFYQPGTVPGVAGPTNGGFGSASLACSFSPGGEQTADMSGVMCGPTNQALFSFKNAMTMTAWVQSPAAGSDQLPTPFFESVMGCGDTSFRFDLDDASLPHFAAAPNGDVVGPSTLILTDNLWHFWAGVFDPVSTSSYLYIDGLLVGQAPGVPLTSSTAYFLIGGVADYFDRNFVGNIAHVALFTNALTEDDITTLYNAAGVAPQVNIPTNTLILDQGANGTFAAGVVGTPPISLQWFYIDSGSVTHVDTGETNATLTITDAEPAQNNDQFFLVASNNYGAVTSAIVTLSVVAGPPQIQVDVGPASQTVPVGVPVTYSVVVAGSSPFYYQWFLNSTNIPGATNSSYSFTSVFGTNTYSVTITNSLGSTPSAVATLIGVTNAPPIITFNDDGTDWTINAAGGSAFTPTITAGVLELTDGAGGEAGSAFYNTPQYIGGFVTSFTYTEANGDAPLADGATFCLQNSAAGATAVGGGGGELGVFGISPSAAFEINIYNGANGGIGIQYGTNGSTADTTPPTSPYFPTTPVNVASANPINVKLTYGGSTLTVLLTDTVTSNSYTTNFHVGDLTVLMGADDAYVGFTGATGGADSLQTISNFTFSYTVPTTIVTPKLGISISGSTVTVSWPATTPTSFVLQSAISVQGPWTNVATTPTSSGGNFTVTATAGTTQFYRLVKQ